MKCFYHDKIKNIQDKMTNPTEKEKSHIEFFGIIFGKGFPASNSRLYPHDRLLALLNVNPKMDHEIYNYCKNHLFIPRDVTNGLVQGFIKEQAEIKKAVEKLMSNQPTKQSLSKITKNISTIKQVKGALPKSSLVNYNLAIGEKDGDDDYLAEMVEDNVETIISHHKGTIASIWEDIANMQITQKIPINCLECTKYFIPTGRGRTQLYCSQKCSNNANHLKRYAEKKIT